MAPPRDCTPLHACSGRAVFPRAPRIRQDATWRVTAERKARRRVSLFRTPACLALRTPYRRPFRADGVAADFSVTLRCPAIAWRLVLSSLRADTNPLIPDKRIGRVFQLALSANWLHGDADSVDSNSITSAIRDWKQLPKLRAMNDAAASQGGAAPIGAPARFPFG
ncbi:hypothetical protein [Chitiniphilus eburneus]|uniref:Uncharacterized protein n=1 Tax=Chitiniphilus eburneus TaxID=2571148 RepID=A0A4U0PWV5_9NEIS|nr:hypothetical protein [Chitiniphilus eburneus]TJZ73031.1 hypothetical protein FAZ21_11510 [Chitiniphilus eburneus]